MIRPRNACIEALPANGVPHLLGVPHPLGVPRLLSVPRFLEGQG